MNDEVIVQQKPPKDLRKRTKQFALRVIGLYNSLPRTMLAQTLGKQMLRSGTSVGAHYREAHRSRSTAEFISKLETGLQELDETAYWLELLSESAVIAPLSVQGLQNEANELTAILVQSCIPAKMHREP